MSELEEEIRVLAGSSLSLAVARFVHDRPEARDRAAPVWLDTDTEAWSARSTEEIEREAAHRLDVLEAWEREVQDDDPELAETRRIDALHARLNLQSARSGAFGTAAGPLRDFLRSVGEEPDALNLF